MNQSGTVQAPQGSNLNVFRVQGAVSRNYRTVPLC